MSHDSIRPQQNLSAERGQTKQDLCGLDEDGLDYDEEEEESEKCGDSEDEVEVADDVKSQEEDTKIIDEEDEPTIGEEAPVRMTRNPADPTAEERERHDATHLPFRAWCPVCVAARATEDPHYRATVDEKAEGKPQVCADYCQIGDDIEDKTDKQECLVARDKWTKMMHACIAEVKGNEDDNTAKQLSNFIMNTGYHELELKTDGEPSLVAVAKRTQEITKVNIILKNPAAYDPQANGMAERAVREFKEQFRAVKIAIERMIKTKIQKKAPILHWMVLHAVETINRFLVGADGRTPHYRLHGRNFIGKVIEFGEVVHAKPLRKKPRKRSLRSRTVLGIWLGIEPRTGEHRVALLNGGPAIRVRTVLRVPDSEK